MIAAIGVVIASLVQGAWSAEAPSPAETRLADAVKYLASDELEGRGIGTKGLDAAADYIAAQFTEIGLKTDLFDGKPFQKFEHAISAKKGAKLKKPPPVQLRNVVAVLEGEGPLANETIVMGAHYDHIGYGRGRDAKTGQVHNGADDNASGVAVLIEVARRLAARDKKLARRVVFVAFSGEEYGLWGSRHYVDNPPFPLKDTVVMINFDMVGRLKDDKLYVLGTGTAVKFETLLGEINEDHGFEIGARPSGYGASDQMPFHAKKIPVMHFITGIHRDMHKPTDDFDKINVRGMRRIAVMVTDVVTALAEAKQRPKYVQTKPPQVVRRGNRPFFGSIPDFGRKAAGFAIMRVVKDAPAARAGLKDGDVVTRFGERKISSLQDFLGALGKHKAGDKVKTVVHRGEEELTVTVTLAPPK